MAVLMVCSAMRSAAFFVSVFISHGFTPAGVPQPRVEWYKDAAPLSKLANTRYKVTATGLTVRRVQPGDGGIFQCLARSAAGETQAHTRLLVSSECV